MKKLLLLTLMLSIGGFAFAQTIDEDFNSGFPSGWTTIDGGSNDGTWYYDDGGFAYNGTNGISLSTYPGPASDHLITPQYQVQAGDVLAFYINCSSSSYPDNLHVLISKTGTEAADFTDTIEYVPELSTDWTRYEYNLTDQDFIAAGDQIYVALYSDSEGDYINLDNFLLGERTELIYEEFTDSIPEGWTVIDEGTNTNTWTDTSELGYNDSPCLWVDCYDGDLPNAGACDDWLITPQFEVRQGDYLSFWAYGGYFSGEIYDTIFVKISKTGVQKADFTIAADTVALLNEADFIKFSWLLTDIQNVDAGDQIHVGLHARSNGSRIWLDNFRVGQYVPPKFTEVYSVSETAIDVWYDIAVTDGDMALGDIKLQGNDGTISFDGYEIDANNNKLVHFTGASANMTGDNTADTLINTSVEDSLAFYSGILPLGYLSLTNPEGTLINDGPAATFKGIVSFINDNGERVWLNDDAGAHHGVNTYQSGSSLADSVSVGDEVLVYGNMSAYDNQTEIYPAYYLTTLSTGNDLFDPTVVTGADIDSTLESDSDPAEQYEGTLLMIDSAEVKEFVSMEPEDGDTLYYYVCNDGEADFVVGHYNRFGIYTGDFTQQPMEVGEMYKITGILINRGGRYLLAPRYEADMSVIEETGYEDLEDAGIEMYPNPMTSRLIIETDQPADRITLFNAIGQQVRVIHPQGESRITINTGELKHGVYFVTFEQDGRVIETGKVIKSDR